MVLVCTSCCSSPCPSCLLPIIHPEPLRVYRPLPTMNSPTERMQLNREKTQILQVINKKPKEPKKKKANKQIKQQLQPILPAIIPQYKMLHRKLKTGCYEAHNARLVSPHTLSLHDMSCLILHIKFFPPWETSLSSPKLLFMSTLHCDKVFSMTRKWKTKVTFIYLFGFEGIIICRWVLKCTPLLTWILL